MHSVYDEQVGLPSPLTAEIQFFCCDLRRMFQHGRELHQIFLTCPPVKERPMDLV